MRGSPLPREVLDLLEWPYTIRGETPPPPRDPPSLQTKVTKVEQNEIYDWKNLVGLFVVHKFSGPRAPLPFSLPSSNTPPPPEGASGNSQLPKVPGSVADFWETSVVYRCLLVLIDSCAFFDDGLGSLCSAMGAFCHVVYIQDKAINLAVGYTYTQELPRPIDAQQRVGHIHKKRNTAIVQYRANPNYLRK